MKTESWLKPLMRLPLSLRPLAALQRRHFGQVLNPLRFWGRTPFLFWLVALFFGHLERRKSPLSPTLRALLMTRISQLCHCAFCIDANSLRLANSSGSLEKVLAVADWQNSTLFDDTERLALEYAEAATATPPRQDTDLQQRLRARFTEHEITEITALIAFQNLSARFNSALAIPDHGLCPLPQTETKKDV
ncbi:hypothetical protein TUM12370_22480 [Salmonella enterica subsp. enterica serovar Choleraesuis]|nr:hypothetical protein TUM12370_22480 [Salmonella enterica subsp. enterica serovar Choleraesuis]